MTPTSPPTNPIAPPSTPTHSDGVIQPPFRLLSNFLQTGHSSFQRWRQNEHRIICLCVSNVIFLLPQLGQPPGLGVCSDFDCRFLRHLINSTPLERAFLPMRRAGQGVCPSFEYVRSRMT